MTRTGIQKIFFKETDIYIIYGEESPLKVSTLYFGTVMNEMNLIIL